MAKATARQIADGLLAFCNHHGDLITNLKLQKLVYYAQAWWLALNDRSLFDGRIEAWVHGPVQPTLYHDFKNFGWKPILIDAKAELTMDVQKHLADVLRAYGRYSAFELEQLTHSELPWQKARGAIAADEACNNEISLDDMKTFYRGLLDAEA